MKLLVVIVNYRTPGLALACLRSLEKIVHAGLEVSAVVIDNCSGDDSAEILQQGLAQMDLQVPATFMQSTRNGGFAYGNNEVLRQCFLPLAGAAADVVWLLNPDTYLKEGNIQPLLEFMQANPQVGIVGSRVEDEDGTVRRSAFRKPSIFSEVDSALAFGPVSRLLQRFQVAPAPSPVAVPVDWVSGASLFISAEVVRRIGLMDENYFMYFEETDYCLAAQAEGYQVWYWPDFSVVHLVGQASGVTGTTRMLKRRPKYWFDSRAYFFRKNFGGLYLHMANMAWLLCYPLGRLWQWLRRKPCEDPPRLWWDFLRYYYLRGRAI
nr:glycosyltransferase family 2 protein [uncultured Pseudomonas sp.]